MTKIWTLSTPPSSNSSNVETAEMNVTSQTTFRGEKRCRHRRRHWRTASTAHCPTKCTAKLEAQVRIPPRNIVRSGLQYHLTNEGEQAVRRWEQSWRSARSFRNQDPPPSSKSSSPRRAKRRSLNGRWGSSTSAGTWSPKRRREVQGRRQRSTARAGVAKLERILSSSKNILLTSRALTTLTAGKFDAQKRNQIFCKRSVSKRQNGKSGSPRRQRDARWRTLTRTTWAARRSFTQTFKVAKLKNTFCRIRLTTKTSSSRRWRRISRTVRTVRTSKRKSTSARYVESLRMETEETTWMEEPMLQFVAVRHHSRRRQGNRCWTRALATVAVQLRQCPPILLQRIQLRRRKIPESLSRNLDLSPRLR